MLVVEFEFLTGRFHTTPWGRNVNEAVPEWPPSPYRLVRALYDVWKRKRPDWSTDRVIPLFEMLSSSPPSFYLPPATAFSTRTFLSENVEDILKRQLIYDGFVVLNPQEKVLMGWSDLNPSEEQKKDLNELLSLLNYFGRSESWVKANIEKKSHSYAWNCYPAEKGKGGKDMMSLPVAMPMKRTEYDLWSIELKPSKKKEGSKKVEWLDALTWTTDDMFKAGLSEPPAFEHVTYLRPANCFNPLPAPKTRPSERKVNAVLYSMESKVPPQIISAIEVAERARVKLMGIHKRIKGDPSKVSPKFSGKNIDGSILKGHKHAYILPLDMNGDGRIDHLLIRCKEPFDRYEQTALDHLTSLWQSDGKPDIRCIPIQWGTFGMITGTKPTKRFRSETPFVTPRHYRKGRGDFGIWLANEVKREARNHGLPEPVSVKPMVRLNKRGHHYYWLEFRRSRKGQSAKVGYGFEIEFAEPIEGPFSLGYGAHFGLGLFVQDT